MTDNVSFLEVYEVLLIHEDQINLYGGDLGIRSVELLESAVNMPSASFEGNYLHKTIFDKASAYIFHISQNHPFIDGNKRTALATGLVFLDLNGIELEDVNENLYDMMIQVSGGGLSKEEIAIILERLVV
ncbi:MAG TPA: type II toxin-antitoxin system death-on-curing family toxin [Leptospiraceae bacterium]|nr:type II toxin-antitoxin system death-on-curing family toxin [Leptospiraceae bacterium]HRG76363.1 type II toxin-antitoxin system death-on-curing family toxin [Leptospiraceae bacterium]